MIRILVAACVILALFATAAVALDGVEGKKIEFLISSVENLDGAVFVRNGSEYDRKKAGEHLRMKVRRAGGKVRTVDDFIRLCSKSLISGDPYLIRLPKGREVTAEEFFKRKLKEYPPTAK